VFTGKPLKRRPYIAAIEAKNLSRITKFSTAIDISPKGKKNRIKLKMTRTIIAKNMIPKLL